MVGALAGGSTAGEAEIERLRSEYPAAAKRIAEQYEHLRGVATIRHTRAGSGGGRLQVANFATSGELRKVVLESRQAEDGPVVEEQVVCLASDSGFRLSRKPGQTSFVISGLDQGRFRPRHYLTSFGQFLEAPYSFKGGILGELIQRDDARILSAEPIVREDRTLLAVVFEHGAAEKASRFSLILDPGAGWVVRHCEMTPAGSPQPLGIYDVEYAEGGSVPPYPSRVRFEEGNRVMDCRFDRIEAATVDPAEFTLDHYSLGPVEVPVSGRGSGFGRTWWIAGLVLVALALAAVFRRLSR